MKLDGLHEKEIFTDVFPYRIATNSKGHYNYPSHWHTAVELVYAAEGNCIVNVDSIEYELTEKDILIIAPGDIHSFHTKVNTGLRYFIQFDYAKLFGYYDTHGIKNFQFHTEMISCSIQKKPHADMEKNILEILREYENKAFAYDIALNARLLDIIVILQRNFSSSGINIKCSVKTNELSKLDKAFKFISENYQNNITLKDVSASAGFSEYHFSRVFKKITEKNFHRFLSEYRIKKLEILLQNSNNNITITEAAHASGFNSIVTFNRIFKTIKGCTPTEYMKIRI